MIAVVRMNLDIEPSEASRSLRLARAAESLTVLAKRYEKLLIIGHRGRPEGRDASLSLAPIAVALARRAKVKIDFLADLPLRRVRRRLDAAPAPYVAMLENIRFERGEEKNDRSFGKLLASLGDLFVNDDFATAHRKVASTVAITKFLPCAYGPTLAREVASLRRVLESSFRPFVAVVGGAKMSDKIGVIRNLLPHADAILTGGGAANVLLKARGAEIGSSIFEPDMLPIARRLARYEKIVTPLDWIMKKGAILDIGPKTIRAYREAIREARSIVWVGPLGVVEDTRYARGSSAVARAIARSDSFSIAGGGETTTFILRLRLGGSFDLLSTGGGALLDLLSGKKLPALVALDRRTTLP